MKKEDLLRILFALHWMSIAASTDEERRFVVEEKVRFLKAILNVKKSAPPPDY